MKTFNAFSVRITYPLLLAANYASIWILTLICAQRFHSVCEPWSIWKHRLQVIRNSRIPIIVTICLALGLEIILIQNGVLKKNFIMSDLQFFFSVFANSVFCNVKWIAVFLSRIFDVFYPLRSFKNFIYYVRFRSKPNSLLGIGMERYDKPSWNSFKKAYNISNIARRPHLWISCLWMPNDLINMAQR